MLHHTHCINSCFFTQAMVPCNPILANKQRLQVISRHQAVSTQTMCVFWSRLSCSPVSSFIRIFIPSATTTGIEHILKAVNFTQNNGHHKILLPKCCDKARIKNLSMDKVWSKCLTSLTSTIFEGVFIFFKGALTSHT